MAKHHLLPSVRRRKSLKAKNHVLYDQILDVLYRHDPIAIASKLDGERDEYEPEVDTILPRLPEVRSFEALAPIIHEEFVRWFGPEIAGGPEDYAETAQEIWELWAQSGFDLPKVPRAS